MGGWLSRYFSVDDVMSLGGYVVVTTVIRVVNPTVAIAQASVLGAGMLAIFWLASPNVRARNSERRPNTRVVFWALVAVVSALISFR